MANSVKTYGRVQITGKDDTSVSAKMLIMELRAIVDQM